MKRKLTAALCCLLMAFGGLAVMALPASAGGPDGQSCYHKYESRQVQTGTRPETYTYWTYEVHWGIASYVKKTGTRNVPVYTTVWGLVRVCDPIYNHSHSFCEQWRTQATNPDTMGVDGNVEVGAVGTLICALWVQRGH